MRKKSFGIRLPIGPLAKVLAAFLAVHFFSGLSNRSALEVLQAQNSQNSPLLRQGVTLSGVINGTLANSYEVDLSRNEYLNVTIAKNDLQIKLNFYAPDGKNSSQFISRRSGPLHTSFIADHSCRYRLQVLS